MTSRIITNRTFYSTYQIISGCDTVYPDLKYIMVPALLEIIAASISECEAVVIRTGTTGGIETAIGLCQLRYI